MAGIRQPLGRPWAHVCTAAIPGSVAGFLLLASLALADEAPLVTVEGQPLASNVQRLLRAAEAAGQPIVVQQPEALSTAIERQDGAEIQRQLDPLVLAVISISPEERVSATRGPAAARLQQGGYQMAVLKIINHSTSTGRLNVTSPQAGAVYAGASALSLQRQRQTELGRQQNEGQSKDRFLDLQLVDQPPMTRQLSGLAVEYVLLLLASAEAGKREAVLQFDLGDDTADLEFRNEVPVLMEVQPAVPVRLTIADDDGRRGIARLEFRDAQGRVYPLQSKRLAPDFFFQPHIYRRDGETVLLPPGQFHVQCSRGPEYHVQRRTLQVTPGGDNRFEVRLQRWIDPAARGYFSGDHHIHAAGCAHYTSPTEGVSPEDMYRQVQGEGLNVGCVLTWGPCYEYQRQFFQASAVSLADPQTLLKYDLEISGFGSQALGHVCLLNLQDQTYPGSDGTKEKGWPTWTTPVMRWAKQQGGYAGYAHSASGLKIDPPSATAWLLKTLDRDGSQTLSADEAVRGLLPLRFASMDTNQDGTLDDVEMDAAHAAAAQQLPNLAIPEMNGVGAMEICVSTVAGVCDFISAMDTARIQEWNTWYHLLNCGFPLKVSGETDFPCMSSRRVGQGRVYVQLPRDEPLRFDRWCEGLAAGRSYVSDGYAHALRFTVNDTAPGGGVQLNKPATVTVVAEIAFAPEIPRDVIYGTASTGGGRAMVGDTVQRYTDRNAAWQRGAKRQIELIVNGKPVAQREMIGDGKTHRLEWQVPIDRSSWVAVRHFPQLHTNPVNVIVAGQPIRASRSSAQWCAAMTRRLWHNRQQRIADDERDAARQAFDEALTVLERIADEAPQGS